MTKINHALIPIIESISPEKAEYLVEYLQEEAIRLNIQEPATLPQPFEEEIESTSSTAGFSVTNP